MKNTLRVGLALLVAMAATALPLAAEGPPLAHERLGVSNGCFVESVALIDSFNETFGSDGWARLLKWGAQKDDEDVQGHAVAVCQSDGKLWCWDVNFGWRELKNSVDEKEQAELISPALTVCYPANLLQSTRCIWRSLRKVQTRRRRSQFIKRTTMPSGTRASRPRLWLNTGRCTL